MRRSPLEAELARLAKKERRLSAAAEKARPAAWKVRLRQKIPEKVYSGLESAFAKAFSLIFTHGTPILEKTLRKDELKSSYAVRDFAVRIRADRRSIRRMQRHAKRADLGNLAATTAEGVALGALGVGMPDIVLFLATLLRGIYETALNYGYDYESPSEQLLILTMMAASLSTGGDRRSLDSEVDTLLTLPECAVTEEEVTAARQTAAKAFAMDMLVLKFIQGIPIIGILGGAANPVYYRRVLTYIRLKYHKRYLLSKR